MNYFSRSILLAGIFIFILVVKVSAIVPPFTNTWYGFNTETGNQRYFLNSARLVDIDNDGDSDVVAAKYFAGFSGSATGFVVLKNDGTGFFNSPPVEYSSPATSQFVFTADLNSDGWQDVIVSNTGIDYDANSISVYLNQGNGIFGNPSNYTVGEGPVGISAADFNGDNKPDIAVVSYGRLGIGNSISVLMNNGDGTFGSATNFPAGDRPFKIEAGKINSDNFIDLVIANENGKVNVLINSGTGDFSNRTEYSFILFSSGYWPGINLTDIDNDNDLDILYTNGQLYSGGILSIGLLRNTGTAFSPPELIPTNSFSGNITNLQTADLNGDGWKDIAATSSSARTTDGYQVILNNGSGGFLPSVRNPAGQNTMDILTGDVDNDGKIDILTTDAYSMQITVHKNSGTGTFQVPDLFETGASTEGSVDAADIDGDGDLDVIVSGSGRAAVGVPVMVMMNLGNGNFGPGVSHSIRGGGVQAKFRDLNGDHKPDILFASAINSPPYDFHYAINNGDGTFGAVQTKPVGSCGWYDIDAVDMNNDGTNDVILTEWLGCPDIPTSARRVFIYLNSGNAGFSTPIIKVVGPHPAPIGFGDFNNDGKMDIVTGVSGAQIELNLGMGNGDLMAPVAFSIGDQGGATDIVVEDFNRDGKPDVASCNFWEGTTMSVLFGNGDGTFQTALILPSAYSPDLLNVSGITAGDLDNDGDKDIIVANYASNSFSLYYNNNGTFEYTMRAGAYSGVSAPFFGDFNNDGKGDLIALGGIPPSGIGSNLMFIKGRNTGLTSVLSGVLNTGKSFNLNQNYPNPFNPVTKISFDIPKSGIISMNVYDVTGKLIDNLINEFRNAGSYNVNFNGNNLPSGVYFYILSAPGGFTQTKKMILLK